MVCGYGVALEPAPEVAPHHSHAADHGRVSWQAVESNRQVVERRGAHEVLPEPGPKPPGADALLAGTLGAQVDETDGLQIATLGDPAEHATSVAVDAVPHDLAHKAAGLLEAGDTVELSHAHRHLVPTDLRHQRAALRVEEPRLAGGRPDTRVALIPLHKQPALPRQQ